MAVIEILQLRLKDGVAAADPTLLSVLQTVRKQVKTHSRFYSCIEDPSLIYIFGEWESLEAHKEFLASPESKAVLAPQQVLTDFQWAIHSYIKWDTLPLQAPVMSFARKTLTSAVKGDESFEDLRAQYFELVVASRAYAALASEPYGICDGMGCDGYKHQIEALIFNGWKSYEDQQEHAKAMAGNDAYKNIPNPYASMEVCHLVDIE